MDACSGVFTAGPDPDLAGLCRRHIQQDRLAAHVAVLDVFLFTDTAVDQDLYGFTTVWTLHGYCLQKVHALLSLGLRV